MDEIDVGDLPSFGAVARGRLRGPRILWTAVMYGLVFAAGCALVILGAVIDAVFLP